MKYEINIKHWHNLESYTVADCEGLTETRSTLAGIIRDKRRKGLIISKVGDLKYEIIEPDDADGLLYEAGIFGAVKESPKVCFECGCEYYTSETEYCGCMEYTEEAG